MQRSLKGLDYVSWALAIVGGAIVVFAVGLTVVSVLWRYVLNSPIHGIEDVSRMSLAVIVAGSIAYGARQGAHVKVDVLEMVGGRAWTRYTDVVVRVLSILIVGAAAFALFEEGLCGFECGEFTVCQDSPGRPPPRRHVDQLRADSIAQFR
jgi:TRAP-type C4-dicarboxylate transport system permease small subunit